MLPNSHRRVVERVVVALQDPDVAWALTGSTSFALQGVDIHPNGIDIQTDERAAYTVERLLGCIPCIFRPESTTVSGSKRITWSNLPDYASLGPGLQDPSDTVSHHRSDRISANYRSGVSKSRSWGHCRSAWLAATGSSPSTCGGSVCLSTAVGLSYPCFH